MRPSTISERPTLEQFPAPSAPEAPPPRRRRTILIVGAVILALVAAGLTAFFLTRDSEPEPGGREPGQSTGGPATGKSTEGVVLEALPAMLLTQADLELEGFSEGRQGDIPNEVMANTSGTEEPVTLDDPDYGGNLANLQEWGRLGGYGVTFGREVPQGEINAVEVELSLSETPEGAHDLFVGWFAAEASGCLSFAEESDCSGVTLQMEGVDWVSRWATFRVGRIIAQVGVEAEMDPGADHASLDPVIERLAQQQFDRIQSQL